MRMAEAHCGRGDHVRERKELGRAIAMDGGNAGLYHRRAAASWHVAARHPSRFKECYYMAYRDLWMAQEIGPAPIGGRERPPP